jgi:hypothetical protein
MSEKSTSRVDVTDQTAPALALPAVPDLKPRKRDVPLTDAKKLEIIERIAAGETLWAMLRTDPDMPCGDTIRRHRMADPEFDEAFRLAREEGMATRIEEALEFQGAVRTDKALSVAASKYLDGALKTAEKLAPRTMGPLLRHAGHDGGKLSVHIVEHKLPDKPAIDHDAPVLPAILPKLTDSTDGKAD